MGFGLSPLKKEGGPLHPDFENVDLTDEQYIEQLQNYKDEFGDNVYEVTSLRPELLKYLK